MAVIVDAVLENWRLKVLSLLCALALYAQSHSGQDAKSVVVNLEAQLPDREDKVLATMLPPGVRITIKGTGAELDNLRASSLGLQVDLRGARSGHVTFEPRMVHGPAGARFEVIEFDPAGIDVEWEDRIKRDVPVQVSVVGTPAAGYVVKGAPLAEPTKVSVTGPASDVMAMQDVKVGAFDVRGLSEGSYPRQLPIVALPPRMRAEPPTVFVTANIVRETAERPFSRLAVVVVGNTKAKAKPAEVDVRLVCPPEIVRQLRTEQVVPQAEVTSKEPSGSVSAPVVVAVDGCEAHVTPSSVVLKW
ncbi:MAG: YbbR-like domain-containing protein [Myxococcales bacterium]|nr:YbbR-like domain-containing protein [Myxococcales bacterium]